MKDINEMTREEFEKLPRRKWDEEFECRFLIILPGKGDKKSMHDSGYRCMDFVGVKDDGSMVLLSGCSDVIHIDGIGGYGYKWFDKYHDIPILIPPSGWSIDCLPKSGLLRIWPESKKIKVGLALSSFEIYALTREEKKS